MKGILLRVGIDQIFGEWNSPVDPESHEFVYVLIPEKPGVRFHPGMRRPYKEVLPALNAFRFKSVCEANSRAICILTLTLITLPMVIEEIVVDHG